MKTKLLILLIPLLTFTCKKNKLSPNSSIFGKYNYYQKTNDSPLEYACNSSTIEIIKSDNAISVGGRILTFEYRENDKYFYKFVNENGAPPGYRTHYTLVHFPCSDSIRYYISPDNGPLTIGSGKKINGNNCPASALLEYDFLLCNQGPDNTYCYSSANTQTNYSRNINEVHLFIDPSNQSANIGIGWLNITVPTDSIFTLLPGDYWIGQTPLGDESILDLAIELYVYGGIDILDLYDFKEGHMGIKESGGIYTISFDFTCEEGSKWTGYYNGEIN